MQRKAICIVVIVRRNACFRANDCQENFGYVGVERSAKSNEGEVLADGWIGRVLIEGDKGSLIRSRDDRLDSKEHKVVQTRVGVVPRMQQHLAGDSSPQTGCIRLRCVATSGGSANVHPILIKSF